jgi:CubicO group peptidase (beta-lactamase class C family)
MDTKTDSARSGDILKSSMMRFIDSGDLPGLVYLVEKEGKTYSEALGTATLDGARMQRDTIFRIASLSKPIAGVATMKLIENGTVRLDQEIESLLPEMKHMRVLRNINGNLDDTVPISRSITLEDLLTFRTGTGVLLAPPDTYPIQSAMDEARLGIGPPDPVNVPEPDEWMRRFSNLPLIHQPGEEWMYVTSSELLGVFLARAEDMPLSELLHELIFAPLGMVDTGFSVPGAKVSRFASHVRRGDSVAEFVELDPPVNGKWNQPPAFPSAGAGLVSTIDDFATFSRMLLNNGTHAGRRFLSEWSIQQMTSNRLNLHQRRNGELILGEGNGWGYCVAVRVEENPDAPGHPGSYGWNGGFGTTWLNDRNQNMIAILFTQVMFESASGPESARKFLEEAYKL